MFNSLFSTSVPTLVESDICISCGMFNMLADVFLPPCGWLLLLLLLDINLLPELRDLRQKVAKFSKLSSLLAILPFNGQASTEENAVPGLSNFTLHLIKSVQNLACLSGVWHARIFDWIEWFAFLRFGGFGLINFDALTWWRLIYL